MVILSIIALLTSIIFANLRSARDKAADSAVRANLNTIRSQSEIVFDETGSYLTLFAPGSPALNAYNAAVAASGQPSPTGLRYAYDEWIVQVKLRYYSPNVWCVDSRGSAKRIGDFTEHYFCP